MNITILYPHKRKTKSSTYGIAQMVLDRLLSGGTLHEFYLPQDMPHVCAGCYACMNGPRGQVRRARIHAEAHRRD